MLAGRGLRCVRPRSDERSFGADRRFERYKPLVLGSVRALKAVNYGLK